MGLQDVGYEYEVQMYTECGWEMVNTELNKFNAEVSMAEYKANQPGAYRVKKVKADA